MKTPARTIAISYESKLVCRNWLFYLFLIGLMGYTFIFLVPWDISSITWWNIALPSSLPLRAVFFLNLFQSLIITFITCDIARRHKRAQTRETFYIRPIGNGQFFWAELIGLLKPFLFADIVFIGIVSIINITIPDSPTSPMVYFFYFVIHVVPTLVFITGLSLFTNKLFRHPLISWLILVGFLTFSYIYLQKPLHHILDFRGSLLPNSYSSIIGFSHLPDYLLQRGLFFVLGISLLSLTPLFIQRLPNTPRKRYRYLIVAGVFLFGTLSIGIIYMENFKTRLDKRLQYSNVFQQHKAFPTSRILSHDITYYPKGNSFSATSQMLIQNIKEERMEQIILFLNPGLEVTKVKANNNEVYFRKDYQVIIVDYPLASRETVELNMEYEGMIDEYIYQIDLSDASVFSPPSNYTPWQHENHGNRTAFVSDRYTLLVPEVMWYPVAVAPLKLQPSREINFTTYSLHVKKPDNMTVLSQGIAKEEGNYISFQNLQKLTGISLCIGEYRKRAITIDSLTIEYYTYPGNDFYLKPFDGWTKKIAGYPDGEEYLSKVFQQCRDIIENSQPNSYPFKLLKIIEVPVSFLHNTPFNDNIQPEIAFFQERLCWNHEKPGDLSRSNLNDLNRQEYLLYNRFPSFLRDIKFEHIFTDYTRSIFSKDYPGINLIFNHMLRPQETQFHLMPSRLKHVAEKGLQGIIKENYTMEHDIGISLKVSQLLAYLTTLTSWDSLNRFIHEFSEFARFQEINFNSFTEKFEQHFGQNIKPYMDKWYTSHELPLLTIKDVFRYKAGDTRIIDFKVGNSNNVDGIISIISYTEDNFGKKIVRNWRSYLIKPGDYKQIVVHEDNKTALKLATNFSGCLPNSIEFNQGNFIKLSGDIPPEGVTMLDKTQFYPPEEIIVDNEDENFRLIDSMKNKFKLADLMKQNDGLEYNTFINLNVKTNTWDHPVLSENAYGEYVHSAFTKAAGSGKFKAEWTAELVEKGEYEIFIHRPHFIPYGYEKYSYITNYPGMKNYYTVYTSKGKEEIILEVQTGDPYWISLGTFSLPTGKSRVVLDDRGVPPIEGKYAQLIVADAVKWVKLK